MNLSDAQPSAELFAGDNIWVHYDSGHAYNQTKIVDAFRVVCTETGSFSGERSCLPFIVTFSDP